MTGPAVTQFDGDVSDLLAMFAETFPAWTVACTAIGWWAVRGGLLRETLGPDDAGTVFASTAAELYVRLQDVTDRPAALARRVRRRSN